MTSQESSITSQNSHHIVTLHHSHISLLCVLSLSPQSECPPLHPCISASSSPSDTVFTATVCFFCCHPFFPVCVYRQPQCFHCLAPASWSGSRPHTAHLHPASTQATAASIVTTSRHSHLLPSGHCSAQHTWHHHRHCHCPRDHLSLAAGCANVVCPRRRTACNWHYPPRPRQCGASSQVRGRRMRSADQRPPPAQLGIAAEKSYYR